MILRRGAAIVLIASLPIVVATLFARVFLDASPATAIPYLSDEVAYWTQIAAFQVAGFHGGYTTVDERPARAGFSHFGPHGPAFAMLYGTIARVTGWQYHSGPIFGAVAFVLGAAAWIAIAKPARLRAALILATFWPIVIAAPNTMQEPLHFSIGALLAALIAAVLGDAAVPRGRVWLTWGVLAVAALIRPTWALLPVGLAWQLARRRGAPTGAGLASGVAIAGVLYFAFTFLAAPYRGSTLGVELVGGGAVQGAVTLLRGFGTAGELLFGDDVEPLERFYRFEVLAVAMIATLSAVRGRDAATRRVMAVMASTLWITIAANLALQNTGSWRDYRATTPTLLMTVLAAAATRERWSWGVVAAHLAVAPLAVATFTDIQGERWGRPAPAAAIERFAASLAGQVRYDPALSGWGNTLLISIDSYDYALMGVPRGMGLSVRFDWEDVRAPPRSRYLVLAEPEVAVVSGRIRLRKLADTPLGALYENPDWER
jgi:hypothetical protein